MDNKNLVSIIITTFNSEKYIHRCLLNIINSHYKKIEIIVVDNDSKDKTKKIVDKFKPKKNIKFLKVKNLTLAEARNIGIANANGQWVSFCDCDDIYFPWKTKNQVNILKKTKTIDGVYGEWIHFRNGNKKILFSKNKAKSFNSFCKVIRKMPFNLSTLLIKTQKCPFFLEGFFGSCAEDWEFIIKCKLNDIKLVRENKVFTLIEDRPNSFSKSVYAKQKLVFACYLLSLYFNKKICYKEYFPLACSILFNLFQFVVLFFISKVKFNNFNLLDKTLRRYHQKHEKILKNQKYFLRSVKFQ